MNKIVSFQTMCPLLFRKGDKVAAVLSYLPWQWWTPFAICKILQCNCSQDHCPLNTALRAQIILCLGFCPQISSISAGSVTKSAHRNGNYKHIWEYILERNRTSVLFVINSLMWKEI
jgi:hypothetical protein